MSKKKVKPSGWYYLLAGLVLVAGLVGFGLFLFSGLSGLSDGLRRMVVPGRHELTLSEAGSHTIFYEYQSVVDGKVYSRGSGDIAGLRCSVRSKETGAEIILFPSTINARYYMGGRSGVSVLDFSVASPGKYVFSARYPAGQEGSEAVMTIGHGFVKQFFMTILGGLGMMFGALSVAIAIAVVTFVKRRRSRRRLEKSSAYTFAHSG